MINPNKVVQRWEKPLLPHLWVRSFLVQILRPVRRTRSSQVLRVFHPVEKMANPADQSDPSPFFSPLIIFPQPHPQFPRSMSDLRPLSSVLYSSRANEESIEDDPPACTTCKQTTTKQCIDLSDHPDNQGFVKVQRRLKVTQSTTVNK